MIKGLPGSGKSTKAKELISDGNTVRVNRDLLREMLFFIEKDRNSGQKFSAKKEKLVKQVEKLIVKYCLTEAHKNVVVDDCNLSNKNKVMWEQIALESENKFEIIKIDTPVEECIARDKAREQSVGEKVIMQMAAQHGLLDGYDVNPKEKIKPSANKPIKKIVICDVDGTLADCSHRRHFLEDKKDWKGFFDAMPDDTLRKGVASLLWDTYKDYTIVIVTARPSTYQVETIDWLKANNISYDHIIMRKAGDYRRDDIVKQEMLDNYFFNKEDIEMVIDDRRLVIEMWRQNGLNVINVGGDDNDF
jgi:predicted kinase